MRKGGRKSNLIKKGTKLRSSAKNTAWKAAEFHPAIGLPRSIYGLYKSAGKTARAARDYGKELYSEANRQINKRNPFR